MSTVLLQSWICDIGTVVWKFFAILLFADQQTFTRHLTINSPIADLRHVYMCAGMHVSAFIISSILTRFPTPVTEMQLETITEPPPDLLCTYWKQFKQKHLDSWLHQTCCHWFLRPPSSGIWQTLAFSVCFNSLWMSSWSPYFHQVHFWWGLAEQLMDHFSVHLF